MEPNSKTVEKRKQNHKGNENKDARVAAFRALHASAISRRTCAFCSCKTALSGVKVRAASHFPNASRYFPSFKNVYVIYY